MTKSIKLLVRILLVTIIACGYLFVKRAFADQDVKVLSHQYNVIFSVFLRNKIHKIHKGSPIVLYLKDGSEVDGIYKGYSKYDDSIWVKENEHQFQDGYGIMELLDVKIFAKEPV